MSQIPLQSSNGESPEGFFDTISSKLSEYGQNASNNLANTYNNMTPQHWIRLIVIVGGYMLLRPYALKFITKGAVKRMEEDDAREKAEEAAKLTPNDLRGVSAKLEEQHEDDQTLDDSSINWGQQARVRQRVVLKQMLEAEELRREEEEEDKDIAEFLED